VTAANAAGLGTLLSAEYAAIFGYGQAGAALVKLQAPVQLIAAARSGYDAHRTTRDQLADALVASGAKPPTAQPAYALPFPLTDPAAVLRLLVLIEDRVSAAAVAAVAGVSAAHDRRLIVDVLSAAAVRALRLRQLLGVPTPKAVTGFPGRPPGT
jgi:hypothetical protein